MKATITTILLAMMTIAARPEVITLTAFDGRDQGGERHYTQSTEVSKDQTIELLSITPYPYGNTSILVEKDGEQSHFRWPTSTLNPTSPFIIRGPVKLTLINYNFVGVTHATFRITPERVDPTQTAIVYPGTNNAAKVTMLCSTNLADWSPATNGLYSGDVAKFFRIGIEKTEK